MTDQWVDIPEHDADRGRRANASPPRQREGEPRRQQGGGHPGAGAGARARRSSSTRGRHGGTVALLSLGLPLVGAFVDEAISPGLGVVFAACAVLGPVAAAALSSRAGWWWVLTAPGPVVLASTAVAELFGNSAKYQGSKALATGAARWAISGFPVMAAAVGAALVVVLVRIARDKRNRRG
ncbi:hypothetical protein P3T36_001860 [Kitasatospora sp. MAP12-15]|uniref:DUF6542 domain-containing protein n=1 Tax=unclassified Kitasatospora TaxID=2633591 RepID=UPI002476B928|nr:DUF6542 domain-containing protein [Kitasatospora sp. MAP12-44]MDH6113255.1 hypothetical protein [Kitasatospora sp. MAP12-44]